MRPATNIGQSRCPGRSASSRSPCSHSRPMAPPRYRFQAAGSCGGFPVSSRLRRSPSMSAIAMSATGPQGSLPPGEPSVGTL